MMNLKFVTLCGFVTLASAASMGQWGMEPMRTQRQQQKYEDQQQQLMDMQQEFQDQMNHKLEQQNDKEQNRMDKVQMRLETEDHQFQNLNQMRREQIQERLNSMHQSQSRNLEDNLANNYEFAYTINDHLTGDVKAQTEHRRGDHVQGQYSLIDADGYRRIVDYTANDRDGFNSEVRRLPLNYLRNNNDHLSYAVSNNNLNLIGYPMLSAVSNVIIPTSYSSVTRHDGPGSFNTIIRY